MIEQGLSKKKQAALARLEKLFSQREEIRRHGLTPDQVERLQWNLDKEIEAPWEFDALQEEVEFFFDRCLDAGVFLGDDLDVDALGVVVLALAQRLAEEGVPFFERIAWRLWLLWHAWENRHLFGDFFHTDEGCVYPMIDVFDRLIESPLADVKTSTGSAGLLDFFGFEVHLREVMVEELENHEEPVDSLDFSPAGKFRGAPQEWQDAVAAPVDVDRMMISMGVFSKLDDQNFVRFDVDEDDRAAMLGVVGLSLAQLAQWLESDGVTQPYAYVVRMALFVEAAQSGVEFSTRGEAAVAALARTRVRFDAGGSPLLDVDAINLMVASIQSAGSALSGAQGALS